MKRTWIHHAIIVNEGRRFAGSVVIEGEKIQEIIEGDGAPAAVCDEQIDAQGCFLLPGVIDDMCISAIRALRIRQTWLPKRLRLRQEE